MRRAQKEAVLTIDASREVIEIGDGFVATRSIWKLLLGVALISRK